MLAREHQTWGRHEIAVSGERVAPALGRESKAARLHDVHAVPGGDFLLGVVMGDTVHVLEALEGDDQRMTRRVWRFTIGNSLTGGAPVDSQETASAERKFRPDILRSFRRSAIDVS